MIHGGTAGNILARECAFLFDLRTPAGMDPLALLTDFFAAAEAMDADQGQGPGRRREGPAPLP